MTDKTPTLQPGRAYQPDDLLTTDQVAGYLQLCRRTVERLRIPSRTFGRRRRYLFKHVLAWVERAGKAA